ncbi:hypothetical protein ATX60_01035 [Oenococcus oeni]|uniref:Rep family protein n=1 Tax=Oenococcus oeni TaxID=1247 RepID=UPI0008F94870|nr:Rep family protein [Oenococcus oeni]OIM25775.1 hypothetical protein ATX60_01035 [Oenococcus oeni]
MAENKTQIRSRAWMYTQSMSHLPFKFSDIQRRLSHISGLKRYAYIVHDQDRNKKNELIAPHLHVMLETKNPMSAHSMIKHFSDQEQYLESFSKYNKKGSNVNNGFSYLIHRTTSAIKESKFRYDYHDVVSNFDYGAFIQQISQAVQKASSHMVSKKDETLLANQILDNFADGKLSKTQAEKELLNINGHTLGSWLNKLDMVNAGILSLKSETARLNMIKENKPVIVIYIYGKSGTGKSSLARNLANQKYPDHLYFTGPREHPFDGLNSIDYLAEAMIIDEARSSTFGQSYSEMLQLLDPYRYLFLRELPARYHNASISSIKQIYITSVLNPKQFYNSFFWKRSNKDDPFEQLVRRLTIVIYLTNDHLQQMIFDPIEKKYVPYGLPMNNPIKQLNLHQTTKVKLSQFLEKTSLNSSNQKKRKDNYEQKNT